jgi:hypothetical protein
MATSIADLLTTLERIGPDQPAEQRYAALAQLGRALALLCADGVTLHLPGEREEQLSTLAAAATALAAVTAADGGRVADLAAGCADLIARVCPELTTGSRWGIAVSVTDTISQLTNSSTDPPRQATAQQCLHLLRSAGAAVARAAAMDPPTGADLAVLDHPVPGHAMRPPPAGMVDAMAALLDATRPPSARITLAEALAVTIAARSLARAASTLPLPRQEAGPPQHQYAAAANAWRAVQEALRPFTDGTRRPHRDTPLLVEAAQRLHLAAAPHTSARMLGRNRRTAIATATQHLPTLAEHLTAVVNRWAQQGWLLAYARHLPPRQDRVSQYLVGHRPAGIVRADHIDLRRVRATIDRARLLAIELAASLHDDSDQWRVRPTASHLAAVHRARISAPDAAPAIAAARHELHRQLYGPAQAARPGPRR